MLSKCNHNKWITVSITPKFTVFLKLCSCKTVLTLEQTMSTNKYPSIFLHQIQAIFYIFLCKIEATAFLILQLFCNMHKKCLRTAYCLLWIFFLLSFLWYDFINKKKFPFLCNNHKMLSCLELNFRQRFMVVDMRFENWGMLFWWYLQISPNLFCRLAQIFYES